MQSMACLRASPSGHSVLAAPTYQVGLTGAGAGAGAPGGHLRSAKRLLESVCEHFAEADRTRFRLEHPLANAVFETWRTGG